MQKLIALFQALSFESILVSIMTLCGLLTIFVSVSGANIFNFFCNVVGCYFGVCLTSFLVSFSKLFPEFLLYLNRKQHCIEEKTILEGITGQCSHVVDHINKTEYATSEFIILGCD